MIKKIKSKKSGFSFIEISAVIIIVGVLISAVANGGYAIAKAKLYGARSLTKSSPIANISNLLVWYETTMTNSFSDADLFSTSIGTWNNINPTKKTNHATAGTAPTYTTTPSPFHNFS